MNVRIRPALVGALQRLAMEHHITRSAMVERLVERAVQAQTEKKKIP